MPEPMREPISEPAPPLYVAPEHQREQPLYVAPEHQREQPLFIAPGITLDAKSEFTFSTGKIPINPYSLLNNIMGNINYSSLFYYLQYLSLSNIYYIIVLMSIFQYGGFLFNIFPRRANAPINNVVGTQEIVEELRGIRQELNQMKINNNQNAPQQPQQPEQPKQPEQEKKKIFTINDFPQPNINNPPFYSVFAPYGGELKTSTLTLTQQTQTQTEKPLRIDEPSYVNRLGEILIQENPNIEDLFNFDDFQDIINIDGLDENALMNYLNNHLNITNEILNDYKNDDGYDLLSNVRDDILKYMLICFKSLMRGNYQLAIKSLITMLKVIHTRITKYNKHHTSSNDVRDILRDILSSLEIYIGNISSNIGMFLSYSFDPKSTQKGKLFQAIQQIKKNISFIGQKQLMIIKNYIKKNNINIIIKNGSVEELQELLNNLPNTNNPNDDPNAIKKIINKFFESYEKNAPLLQIVNQFINENNEPSNIFNTTGKYITIYTKKLLEKRMSINELQKKLHDLHQSLNDLKKQNNPLNTVQIQSIEKMIDEYDAKIAYGIYDLLKLSLNDNIDLSSYVRIFNQVLKDTEFKNKVKKYLLYGINI